MSMKASDWGVKECSICSSDLEAFFAQLCLPFLEDTCRIDAIDGVSVILPAVESHYPSGASMPYLELSKTFAAL